jgi:Protein of unknown function with PCYCGC motif
MSVKRTVPIFGVLLTVVAMGVWSVTASATTTPVQKPLGPHKQAVLPPLPFGPRDPLPRPTRVVAAVFQFAAEHPEVLTYVPCFCGCEHLGHHGNEDCFVKTRNANGDVVAWEPHGTECQVCIDVGQQAMQMYSSGASIRQIRDAIEKKWAGQTQNHTPTPPAPAR